MRRTSAQLPIELSNAPATPPWPKCFQNLRASLATDLVQFVPLHQAAEWTGHSIETMRKFYLQITAEHRAAAKVLCKAQQKAQHFMRDSGGNDGTENIESPVFSIKDTQLSAALVGDEGLEPPTSSV